MKKKKQTWKIVYAMGVVDERQAWLKGKRCYHCGKPKQGINMTDFCYRCLKIINANN